VRKNAKGPVLSVQEMYAMQAELSEKRVLSAAQRLTTSKSCEHYTDSEIVEAARVTLGRIDIDPFSCAEANQVVRAVEIIARPNDGFMRPWNELGAPKGPRRAFVNPPSVEPGDVRRAWLKAMSERRAGHIEAVIFVVFRIDALQSMMLGSRKEGYPGPQSAWRCEPIKRLQYWQPGARELFDGSRECTNGAMHGSCILLHTDNQELQWNFQKHFQKWGPIYAPAVTQDNPLMVRKVAT
jgi:hypothetical protein